LENEEDIYTEFVSIDYISEDPKRTLYLVKYNPHWKSEYELIVSNSGFQRHMIPVSELVVINDVIDRTAKFSTSGMVTEDLEKVLFELPDPDAGTICEKSLIADRLKEINETLIILTKVITKLNK
jgi:hypothetical protein